MTTSRGGTGARGENLAATVLQQRGYTIVARNYRCRYGEIDLICARGDMLVFCEVKLRRSLAFGSPEEAVTARKITRLTRTAQTYLAEHGLEDADWRLDVVALEIDARGAVTRCDVYEAVGDGT